MKKWILFCLSVSVLGCSQKQAIREDAFIIAHRGASGYLPEHSLEAVALAYGMGVEYIEQDVVLTKDGIPIILHDPHLDTVTDVANRFKARKRIDGRYYAIDFTLDEIKTLRLTERFDRKTKQSVYSGRFPLNQASFEVPTLEEELQMIQGLNKSTGKNVGIYVEIKAPEFHRKEGRDIASAVLNILNKYGYNSRASKAYIQCFHSETLKALRQRTSLKLVQLIAEDSWGESSSNYTRMQTEEGLQEISKYADGIGPWLNHFNKKPPKEQKASLRKFYLAAKQKGLKVHPYTIRKDRLPSWAKTTKDVTEFLFKEVKVEGAFSDFPDILTE